MDKKTILAGMVVFGLVSLTALGYFQPAGSLRGTFCAEPYPPAPAVDLTRQDGNAFCPDDLRDTPQRVQKYADHFNRNFIGLSGSEESLARGWSDYGIYRGVAEGSPATGYLVDRTARITLIDPQGSLRSSYGFETPVEDIVHNLKVLLQ